MFRRLVDPNFPDLNKLMRTAPLVLANMNELYEFPRPTLHKVVFIGGLGMKFEDAKPLSGVGTILHQELQDYAKAAEKAEGLIVFSFGSVANASYMRIEWKNAFLEAFKEFPKIHFFLRYATRDLDGFCAFLYHVIVGLLPPNVHLSSWLPQRDLLRE